MNFDLNNDGLRELTSQIPEYQTSLILAPSKAEAQTLAGQLSVTDGVAEMSDQWHIEPEGRMVFVYEAGEDVTFPVLPPRYLNPLKLDLNGFEVMRMFRKGQFSAWTRASGVAGEIRLINWIFGVYNMT